MAPPSSSIPRSRRRRPPPSAGPIPAVPDQDRRGVHSIGGLYEQVEGALNQAFPRNRHLWVRGEIQHVSDHRTGHLFLDLVDPEDDGSRRDRARGGVPTLNVKCWRSSWAPLRHRLAKEGIELVRGDGRRPARLPRPLPGQGRDQPDPRRGRRHRAVGASGRPAGGAPAQRSRPRAWCGATRACVFPRSRCTSA